MIIRTYSPTGQRGPDISLDLPKAEAFIRLQGLAKSGDPSDPVHTDLASLDAGSLGLATVLRLFPRDTIEQAGRRRLKELEPGTSEWRFITAALENLSALLASDTRAWRAAQGGSPALGAGDRFGIRRNPEAEPEAHVKVPHEGLAAIPMHVDPKQDEALKWARRHADARAAAHEAGWRMSSMVSETAMLHHPYRPGESLMITGAGSFRHAGRDVKATQGPGSSLEAFLRSLQARGEGIGEVVR